MKIRRDVLAVSSVLFTMALLMLAPDMWWDAATIRDPGLMGESHPLYRVFDCFAPMGFASLAVIVVGLIVTWAGFIRGVPWTWFVMFVILWGWDFPVFMLLYVHRWKDFEFIGMIASGIWYGGLARVFVEYALTFLLMVFALVNPVIAFISGGRGGPGRSERTNLGVPGKSPARWNLNIWRDPVAVSSMLFTLALLMLVPAMWRAAATLRESSLWGYSVSTHDWPPDCFAPAGIASLAAIAIGLIVTWAGFIKRLRWTWFVMFVIVWMWAFPVLILPYLLPWRAVETMAQSFASSISGGGPARNFVEVLLLFLLMLLGLLLPVKTFVLGRGGGRGRSGRTNVDAPDNRTMPET